MNLLIVVLCLLFVGAECAELPRRDHIHHDLNVASVAASTTFVVDAESAKVVYTSDGFLDRNRGRAGDVSEPVLFPTLEAAQAAGIRHGYVTAYIESSRGSYAWEPRFREWLRAA